MLTWPKPRPINVMSVLFHTNLSGNLLTGLAVTGTLRRATAMIDR
jgi:hypothetical protein